MPYGPHTDADRRHMLDTIGVGSLDELFADIPEAMRADGLGALGAGKPETALMPEMERRARRNRGAEMVSFLGAGAYRHYVPAVVDEIIRRGEFMTAYTPYQPEVSQGTLQTIFEFQSLIGELYAMDIVSASHYDGATATAEAALMMLRATRRERIVVSQGVHPHTIEAIRTYLAGRFTLEIVPVGADGLTDPVALGEALADRGPDDGDPVAGLIMAQPNVFGVIEDLAEAGERAHAAGGLFTVAAEPTSLSILAPPGEVGADIACGEGQPLGIGLQYGGPYVGLLASTEKLARQIPGRLVGRAVDEDGRPCYVMTMRAREQDIRREKAASNICTNQALCALAATVYLAAVGPVGLRNVAETGAARARELETSLAHIGLARTHTGPYLNEFAIRVTDAQRVHDELLERGFIAGMPLRTLLPGSQGDTFNDDLLVCATEVTTTDDIASFVAALAEVTGR